MLRSGLAWTFALADSSRVILDQNGAEELTPPGQAILVRGVETLKVMSPFLPDEERAQRLAKLRQGELELSDDAKLVLEAMNSLKNNGTKPSVRNVYDRLKGQMSHHKVANNIGLLRSWGLVPGDKAATEGEDD